jgi:tripartite-type tricarboxylate transporter receptor subunit TctC
VLPIARFTDDTRLFLHLSLAVLMLAIAVRAAAADQEYPTRPITFVVPFSAGGAVDAVARVLGEYASRRLGQPIVVENVTGAGGTIAAARVARAVPDGYTILVGNLGTQVSSVGNYKNLPYDPRHDFAPIVLVANTPEVLIINNNLPYVTLRDFVAYSKANGRNVTIGSAGVGSISHLAYLLFNSLAKTNTVHVPYRGDPDADTDLIGGRIDAAFNWPTLASPFVKSGKVRGLVVAAPQRWPSLPDVPSSPEAGMPELQVNAWTALFAPSETPDDVIRKLNAAIEQAFAEQELRQRWDTLGLDVPTPEQRNPAALNELIDSEFSKWLPLIQSAEGSAKP